MVGSVTVLIAIVAVFLAYNANQGLPFVPVYSVSVEVPNAARTTDANEVRIGGTRVGVIESIEPIVDTSSEQTVSVNSGSDELPTVAARVNLKLDPTAQPLPTDSIFRIRYRSAFGLKYIEVVRGTGPPAPEGYIFNGLDDGPVCALPTAEGGEFEEEPDEAGANGCFQDQNEFDDLNNTSDNATRKAQRENFEGYGDAFATRGLSLNDTIQNFEPLFRSLGPVARALKDPSTRFNRLFPALARTADLVQPVASLQAEQFAFAARTFEAISRDPEAYATVIEQGPETLRTAIALLPAQREFNRKLADLAIDLTPGIADLRRALPDLNKAVEVGTPVLRSSPPVNRRLKAVFGELKELVTQPSTRITLMRLRETFDEATPLVRYVAPAQTVCNYWNYWFTYFPNALSDVEPLLGNAFRQTLTSFPPAQRVQTPLGGYSGVGANGRSGPADPPPGSNDVFKPYQNPIVNSHAYGPTGQRDADCQPGQIGYPLGADRVRGQLPSDPGNRVSDIPGSRGPTMLFWNKDGDRQLIDTRNPANQPETWEGYTP
jgi:ABC-type transporter Mla subunit MlaD